MLPMSYPGDTATTILQHNIVSIHMLSWTAYRLASIIMFSIMDLVYAALYSNWFNSQKVYI